MVDGRATAIPSASNTRQLVRACPRINFVGSLCRKLCRTTPLLFQKSTKFATKAADKEPKIAVWGEALVRGTDIQRGAESQRDSDTKPRVARNEPVREANHCNCCSFFPWRKQDNGYN